jgi:transcriptional regulator with XRE-family HTH domain
MIEHYITGLLHAKKMSIVEFCGEAKITRQTYYNWMKGTHLPRREYIWKIAGILCIHGDDEYILKLEEQKQIARQFWMLLLVDHPLFGGGK